MILSRAPLRITLGGGGTDLESYYSKFGGFLIAAGIDRYCTILATQRFYNDIRLSYSKLETCDGVDKIEHRIFRECLKALKIEKNIELHSTADLPSNSGLGSSSSFTVALLNALHTYKGDFVSKKELAEQACRIEIDILGEPIGKQDQYMACFGGVTCLNIGKTGEVMVEPLQLSGAVYDQLESNLVYFFSGKERNASEILKEQDTKSKINDVEMVQNLHQIKDLGFKTKQYLESGNVDALGEVLGIHWEIKKKRSKMMSDPFIDECYDLALKNGALGGKLMGAGGGGFFMFYCPNGSKVRVTSALARMGLRRERFRIDWDGAKILLNTKITNNFLP